jgi:hypothetical protein
MRDPDSILAAADPQDTLDLSQPVALLLIAIVHFIPDAEDPYQMTSTRSRGTGLARWPPRAA